MRTAVFAGSFDPFTIGHDDIVRRGLELFDRIIIGIGNNISKSPMQSIEERWERITAAYQDEERITVLIYDGLTADFARKQGAQFLLRSARNTTDFEYEKQIAEANYQLSGLETVILLARPELQYLSSTLVRDLNKHNYNIDNLII